MKNLGPAPARYDGSAPALTAPRARVLEHLEAAPSGLTVEDVAEQLDLHPNTARKHLEGLVGRGLVESETVPSPGRGRPARLYRATARPEPDTRVREYAALAAVLAGHIARTSRDPHADALAAGESWGRALAAGAERGSAAHARRTVVDLLDGLRFDPDANAGATTVRLRRCPLLDTAKAHPDVVCPVHLGLVRGVLDETGGDVDSAELEPFAEPGACVLRLGSRRGRGSRP